MARKPVTDLSAWPSLTLEGNLIAPAMVASIDRRQASDQTEEDYRIRKGLTIREEVSTAFRVGQSHFDAFAKLQNPSVEATRRFARAFLTETFGFDDLVPADGVISFLAGGRVPIVVVPPSEEKLDRRSPTLSTDRSRSPAFALQDYLNDNDNALWGLVTNGATLRLMRDNASLTRPAYIEADLAAIFTNEDAASFAVLWSLIHRTRFGIASTPVTDCALERWREAGSQEGEAARNRLAAQVETALKVLGSGFLEANPDLAARLQSGAIDRTEWFNELLRLVYRLIFLMVAEDRNLLHPETTKPDGRKLYAEGYSLAVLRAQAARAATWDKHYDRYEGIKVVFCALARGQDALGLPALGGLFSADKLPHLETARLRNRALMEALFRLSWLSDKTGMVPVNWRAMETEELGSVYESLLELQPQLGDDGRSLIFASEAAEQKGNQRKTTGSYYTPDSLVQALLDSALDPVLDKTEAEAADPAQALLKLSIIDPACGSGHFLLAAARRIATRLARICAEGTPSLADFRHALRDVARCCIYGVDRNPMAVELTKVALWIETVDPGLPLGFFDAQIRCGDSLLGVFDLKVLEQGIPDAAYKPLTGDDKDVAKYYAQKNKREKGEKGRIAEGFGFNRARDLMRDFEALRAMPENTVEQVEAKSARLRTLTAQGATAWLLDTACDLYVAAFLLPKMKGGPYAGPDGMPRRGAETMPTSGAIWEWLRGVQPLGAFFGAVIDAARMARAFHWPLEFPDVMQRGGFDVVLGNPPWERIKLQEQEFFAARDPEIAAAANKAARERLIRTLRDAELGTPKRKLFEEFEAEKRLSEATSIFVRVSDTSGGRFPFTGTGDINTYALFAEIFSDLRRHSGRSAGIIPTGIIADSTYKEFFQNLTSNKSLISALSFSEVRRWFSGTDDRKPFLILTTGSSTDFPEFAFGIDNLSQLSDQRRRYRMTPDAIANVNPTTKTAPIFWTQAEADICAKMYANVPSLFDEAGPRPHQWQFEWTTKLFDMADDSDKFSTRDELQRNGYLLNGNCWRKQNDSDQTVDIFVPVYEAKMINLYDHRFGDGGKLSVRPNNSPWPHPTDDELINVDYEILPWYWVNEREAERRLIECGFHSSWLLGWRDVTNSVSERTLIASPFPRSAAGHSLRLFRVNCDAQSAAAFLANACSIPLDFIAKQKVAGIHLTVEMWKQFPILPPAFYTQERLSFVAPRVLELTYTSHALAPFARDMGHDGAPFQWAEGRRAQLRTDLDAFYARAYGLTREELRYILDPADVRGADYPSETFRVLKEKEIRQFGEYRTRRLVLEAWDRMEADGTFVALGLQVAAAASSVQKSALPDGVWIRAAQKPNDAGAALTAVLKATNGPTPSRTIRLAAALMLEPHLLTSLLPGARAREWRRLVGQEAEPRMGNVVGFAARTNQGWGAAVSNHRGNGRLIENPSAGTWAPGPGLDAFDTAGWPDGRAGFVLEALRSVDLDTTVTSMPDEVRGWITHAAAA
ncbi:MULTISPECIES: Eco57I restriction-modification methylase domain-containing protein [unclassified Bradyrhizobium]|uniref:Eco57I restriction-modification methylase domain-containing protein n=1 Tax=unclassified Bradyrhizobium TaxID=2631580 RepID=UPI0029163469|nr:MULTISPECIES: N-6 DNA methylase [unclassified Bradyrhizobium]